MSIPLLDLKCQYQSIKAEVDAAVAAVLESGAFILGPTVEMFENSIAEYLGVKHAVGVASGTDALVLALAALGIGEGDEVITTPFTFIASAECIAAVGARPVFVDIDPHTYNIDPNMIEPAIIERTKAIIPVHLYGQPAEMDRILQIGKKHNLAVIEDTAQAFGACYRGERVASMGEVGCLSFFPSKNLGAYGDGGMVVTGDDRVAERLRMLRQHGSKVKYYHDRHGYNSRLDAMQAAILQVKLAYIDEWNEARRRCALRYNELFSDSPVITPFEAGERTHVYHQYTVRVPDRDAAIERLKSAEIGHAIYYPVPLHLQTVYGSLEYSEGDFPVTESACEEVLSLPIFPELRHDEQEQVATAVLGK